MKLTDIELPSNKKFGSFFTLIFLVASLYCYLYDSLSFAYALFTLGVLLLLVTIFNANILLPFNKLWMRFGLLLGKIISPIVMGIIFFGMFTPMSLAMKLLGRDELQRKFKKKQSYWIQRDENDISAETFRNQF